MNASRRNAIFRWVAWACIAALLAPHPLFAQRTESGDVNVRVTDAATEEPIYQADVKLLAFGQASSLNRNFTDSSGRVTFLGVTQGNYNLEVLADGFEPAREGVDVLPGTTMSFYIRLRRKPESPPSVAPGPPTSAAFLALPSGLKQEYGTALAKMKEAPAESAETLKRVIKESPKFAEAYAMLGLLYMRQKQSPQAEEMLGKALELEPTLILAHLLMGKLYVEDRRFAQAEQQLLEAVRLDPQAWNSHFEVARCYFNMGRLPEALKYARRANELPQAPPITHLLLADIYMKLNDAGKAQKQLQDFVKADPKSPLLPRVRQKITELRSQQ